MNLSTIKIFLWTVLTLLPVFSGLSAQEPTGTIRALILSGKNNHDWKRTTAVISDICSGYRQFEVRVTEKPDTLRFTELAQFDVLISNWNSWPENELRWPEETEKALISYIRSGGGMVFFHASTSVFYKWPEFRDISVAAWEEKTHHGRLSQVTVEITDNHHPVTRGMSGFCIFDELWIDAGKNDAFTLLATAKTENKPSQPAVFVREYGKGRIFHMILGHDARAMRNTGFRTLMIRAAEWTATGTVTTDLPPELTVAKHQSSPDYQWKETDTTLSLLDADRPLWQFNHHTKYGKPFFHPIYLNRNRITCLAPDDHRWHTGQWFSWKFINGVNYWEYKGTSYQSEGITGIRTVESKKHSDYSAEIRMEIDYYPQGGSPVLEEQRIVKIHTPEDDRLCMDYTLTFTALDEEVVLDRTPITGEPEGKSWGGYAGLSLRFNQDLMDPSWITHSGKDREVNGTRSAWLYMGFTGLTGEQVGSAVLIHDASRRKGAAWYLINKPDLPFYYLSPAYLYLSPLTLRKADTIKLRYRIIHHTGEISEEVLADEYRQYMESTKH